MPGSIGLELRHLEDGEELMLSQSKEGVAFTTVEFLQVKDVFIKLHCGLHVIDLDSQMIAAVNLHAHARTINQFTGSGETAYFGTSNADYCALRGFDFFRRDSALTRGQT